jgi:transposase
MWNAIARFDPTSHKQVRQRESEADAPRRFDVTHEARETLERWISAGTTPQRIVTRARIVLLAADRYSNRAVARTLKVAVRTVNLWRRRYAAEGLTSLLRDAPGRGRPAVVTTGDNVARILAIVDAGASDGQRWTIRRLAAASGISRASIHRILRAHGRSLDVGRGEATRHNEGVR